MYMYMSAKVNSELLQPSNMNNVPGSIGTCCSICLRLGQAAFSLSSLFFMPFGVGNGIYAAFGFLVIIMTLAIPWSLTLALLDGCSIMGQCPLRQPKIIHIVIVGDSIFSVLTLAAATSTASIVDFILKSDKLTFCQRRRCTRYQMSALLALMSWCLSITSSLTNLWLLPIL